MDHYCMIALSGMTLKESNEEKTVQLSGLWAMPLAFHFVERDTAQSKNIHGFRASFIGPASWTGVLEEGRVEDWEKVLRNLI